MVSSIFNKTTATNIWKSVVSVSIAGRRKGRGKKSSRNTIKDYNRGQEIGVGRKRLVLGGMNAPVIQARRVTDLQDLGQNQEFDQKVNELRGSAFAQPRKFKDMPIERGWAGRRAPGRSAGPPDDYNETPFDGFDSRVLMLRTILSMRGTLGRTRTSHALVVTGNGNGLAGFADAKGSDQRAIIRLARNHAGQSLVRVPLWDNHTVMHDFLTRYYQSTILVERKPKGYGVKANRVISEICRVFGITDINAKILGNRRNTINVTKAFFLGLMNQKSYEEMAEEKRLHVVEMRQERHHYPVLLASPKSELLTDDQLPARKENLDFTYYIQEGRIIEKRPEYPHAYKSLPTYQKHLDKLDFTRNRQKTKLLLAARYGDKKVTDVFPHFRSNARSFNKAEA